MAGWLDLGLGVTAPAVLRGREGAALPLPGVTGAWVVFVARDADMAAGLWIARPVGGAPPLAVAMAGSAAISTAEPWAPGVPVMTCGSGCWYADREAGFPEDFGMSFAICAALNNNTAVFNGPTAYGGASPDALRFILAASVTRVLVGDGTADATRRWSGPGGADGSLWQFDRPAGAGVAIRDWSVFINASAKATSDSGTGATTSSGSRFVIGGVSGATGAITANGNRILLVALKVDGTPGSAADRTALLAYAAGLKTGEIL